MDSVILVEKVVEILRDNNAGNIKVIDISDMTILADYFIICNGTSKVHIKTLADAIDLKLKEMDIALNHVEGYESRRWVLMDYGQLVIHIFNQEEREYYNLERLWTDGFIKEENNKDREG